MFDMELRNLLHMEFKNLFNMELRKLFDMESKLAALGSLEVCQTPHGQRQSEFSNAKFTDRFAAFSTKSLPG